MCHQCWCWSMEGVCWYRATRLVWRTICLSVCPCCVSSVLTLKHGGSVLVPCYPSGVTYDLFKCLSMLCVVSADAEAWRECAGTMLPVRCDVWSVWVPVHAPGLMWTLQHPHVLCVASRWQLPGLLQHLRWVVGAVTGFVRYLKVWENKCLFQAGEVGEKCRFGPRSWKGWEFGNNVNK